MKHPEVYAKFLKDHKLNPEANQADRGDAIHFAILDGNVEIVDEILALFPDDCLEAKAKVGSVRNRLPLHNATTLGLPKIVTKLLEKGADVNGLSWNHYTPLHFAAESGQAAIVDILLRHGAKVNAQTNIKTNQCTPLHFAAQLESPLCLLKLIWNGADIKAVTTDGNTPLHFAIHAQCTSPAALLRFHGASATTRNQKRTKPNDLLKSLPDRSRKELEHSLSCGAGKGDIESVRSKFPNLDKHRDIAAAIHWATERNMARSVAYLLHIDPYAVEATNARGWRPLHMAARYGLDNSISVLLQHGAKIDPVTKTGWTPLMLASERGYKSTINILLERNASRSAKNGDGYNSLQIAAHAGHQISTLLEYRHVAPSAVVNTSDEADKGGLVPPDRTRNMRTPSPAPGANIEVESEFYALSDGIIAETSVPKPENSKKFQSFLKTLEQTWYRKIHWTPDDDNPLPRRDWPGPVKIAILDTGIDLEHPDFSKPPERRSKDGKKAAQQIQEIPQRDRIKAWKSFTGGPEDDVTDSDGHGTHIAGLILTIAPRAELYIARVSTQSHTRDDEAGDSKRRSGELRPIQKALEWAMEQDVDIVNLSLGFARESSYELTTLLEEANHREIIVIAAAANHGNSNAIAWPARDRDLAICITSGDEFDHPSRFAPTPPNDLPIFMTYGENIYSHWPTKLGGGFRMMSGTSVSTPIAVGMVSMILAFLNQTNVWSQNTKRQYLKRSTERRLRSTRGMGRLLEKLCRDRNGIKILSPKLMWEHEQELSPLQVLGIIAQYEADRLAG